MAFNVYVLPLPLLIRFFSFPLFLTLQHDLFIVWYLIILRISFSFLLSAHTFFLFFQFFVFCLSFLVGSCFLGVPFSVFVFWGNFVYVGQSRLSNPLFPLLVRVSEAQQYLAFTCIQFQLSPSTYPIKFTYNPLKHPLTFNQQHCVIHI